MKNRRFLCIGVTVLFIASIFFGVTVIKSFDEDKVDNNLTKTEEKKPEKVFKTYDMYVSINPFVRLTFKAEYETCEDGKSLCFTGSDEIINYELINDDAKTVYNTLDFKGQNIMDVLILLCDVARENKIAYDSISITTNWRDMYDDQVLKNEIRDKSKYEFDFDIFVDIKEYINDAEIKNEIDQIENEEIKEYIVSFNRDNGDSIIKRKVKENEKVAEVKAGNKSGYTFVEWQLDGKKYDFNTPVLKDITLVAKWKKGEATTTTTTTVASGEKTTTTAKKEDPGYTSTIDKINLNENIMVTEHSAGIESGVSFCDSSVEIYYVFASNANSVLSDYKSYTNQFIAESHPSIAGLKRDDFADESSYNSAVENACSIAVSDFNSKINSLTYDTAKENTAKSALDKYKNSTTKGIRNFDYSINNHAFSYSFNYIYMANAESFGDFGKQFNNLSNLSDITSAFKSVTFLSSNCHRGCGDMREPEIKVLNESLCSKYNLTCDRW